MKNKLNRILVIGVLGCSSLHISAQLNDDVILEQQVQTETYEIINSANTDISLYKQAMQNANFDSYRFVSKRRELVFESGVVIELFSVNEIKALGITIDETKAIQNDLPESYIHPTYRLSDNNYIITIHNKVEKH